MKIFHKIHLWMALPFGIVMAIVCLTGALLIIEKPVTTLIYPDFYEVKPIEPAPESARQPTCNGDCQNCKTGCGGNTTETGPVKAEKAEKAPKADKQKKLPFFETTLKLHRWLLDAPQTKCERT